MKKRTVIFLAGMVLSLMLILPGYAEEKRQNPVEWTVMFYLCGSDLESIHGYATGNLEEIAGVQSYLTKGGLVPDGEDGRGVSEKVNVVIQTGGCREWHANSLKMDIKTDVLQRWEYHPDGNLAQAKKGSFEQVDEVPLASMAAPETLTDFIRWSAETYPAKKYALVLWDHGMGAVGGLIVDALFDGDTMPLAELKKSLAESHVHFEAIIFDACLMGSLETAYAVREYANWMIASEEVVAGQGTAVGSWLQQLYCTPQRDGRRLGRWICEMTQVKYGGQTSEQLEDTMTWSVVDLSKIEQMAEAFDQFFEFVNDGFKNHPTYMRYVADVLNEAFKFGLGDAHMIDLARIPYHPYNIILLEEKLYNDLLDALTETVVFNTHGPGRARAGGLSFCYAAELTPEELDIYANVCPSSHYLALMDAINPRWKAPEWIYEKAEKLPEITDMPVYQIKIRKKISPKGLPEVMVMDGLANLRFVNLKISRLNPRTGNIVSLGHTSAIYTDDENASHPSFNFDYILPLWPALEGVHCAAGLVSTDYLTKQLYNIPMQIGDRVYQLRCGFEALEKPITIYGLWEGYTMDSDVFSRSVTSLSKFAGQEYTLLYPIEGSDGEVVRYEMSEPMTIYRSLELSRTELEPGTYYMDYEVEDIFMRTLPVGRVQVNWDGKEFTVPDKTWLGEMIMSLPSK